MAYDHYQATSSRCAWLLRNGRSESAGPAEAVQEVQDRDFARCLQAKRNMNLSEPPRVPLARAKADRVRCRSAAVNGGQQKLVTFSVDATQFVQLTVGAVVGAVVAAGGALKLGYNSEAVDGR